MAGRTRTCLHVVHVFVGIAGKGIAVHHRPRASPSYAAAVAAASAAKVPNLMRCVVGASTVPARDHRP